LKIKKGDTRKLISDVQLNLELKSYFENSITDKTNLYELIRTRFRIGKQRCLNAYDVAINEWRILKEKAVNEQIVDSAKETLKKGILSKEEILKKLSKIAETAFYYAKDGSLNEDYTSQISAMKTISDLQGYKAPAKSETELKFNKEVTITIGE
jgi:DNA polymerase III delta prime subunit